MRYWRTGGVDTVEHHESYKQVMNSKILSQRVCVWVVILDTILSL